jgi:hypothetical protein
MIEGVVEVLRLTLLQWIVILFTRTIVVMWTLVVVTTTLTTTLSALWTRTTLTTLWTRTTLALYITFWFRNQHTV